MKLTEPSARLLAKLYFITQPPKYVFFRSEVGIYFYLEPTMLGPNSIEKKTTEKPLEKLTEIQF